MIFYSLTYLVTFKMIKKNKISDNKKILFSSVLYFLLFFVLTTILCQFNSENDLLGACNLDKEGRIRIDNFELDSKIQDKILSVWNTVNSENLLQITDIEGVKKDFINLFGFDIDGIDYSEPTEI